MISSAFNVDSAFEVNSMKHIQMRDAYIKCVSSSHEHLMSVALHSKLQIRSVNGVRFVKCLEIGFGIDFIGLQLLINKHKVSQKGVVAIELDPKAVENLRKKFPDVNVYQVESDDSLLDLLKYFNDKGLSFNFIYSRYVMDNLSRLDEFMPVISSLMGKNTEKYVPVESVDIVADKKARQYVANSIYAQITRSPASRDGGQLKNPYSCNPSELSWVNYLSKFGYNCFDSGMDTTPLQRGGKEDYLFATV